MWFSPASSLPTHRNTPSRGLLTCSVSLIPSFTSFTGLCVLLFPLTLTLIPELLTESNEVPVNTEAKITCIARGMWDTSSDIVWYDGENRDVAGVYHIVLVCFMLHVCLGYVEYRLDKITPYYQVMMITPWQPQQMGTWSPC